MTGSSTAQLSRSAQDPQLDQVFSALADPTRRAILVRLASGEATVTELAQPFAMSQPAVTKHLKVLERAGLVSRRHVAQSRPAYANPHTIADAIGWLQAYTAVWEQNFARLDRVVAELEAPADVTGGKEER